MRYSFLGGARMFLRLKFSPLCILFLLLCLPILGRADNVTVPLADPQNQSVDQADKPTEPVLTEGQMYDIREPILLPNDNRYVLLAASLLAVFLVLALLLFFWKKRTREQKAAQAHETALQTLEQAGQLIEEQNSSAFVTLIDQTLRRYISNVSISLPADRPPENLSTVWLKSG
ncbi:MAG: hypothetical protein D3923_18700, partial [Candidatus Electrothrix sp. AR3]|nr:hypothetical protein [Candidatus Electrothrix sp. AR3]